MRSQFFTLAIVAMVGFATSDISAQQQGKEKIGGGKQGPSQRAGGPGGGQRGGGPGGGGAGGGAMGSRMMLSMPLYVAIDKDKDGKLSEKEIRNAVAAIRTLDKNKNGEIDAEEMAPDRSQMLGGPGQGGRGGPGMGRGQDQGPGGMRGGSGGQGRGQGGFGEGRNQGSPSGATRPKRPGTGD